MLLDLFVWMILPVLGMQGWSEADLFATTEETMMISFGRKRDKTRLEEDNPGHGLDLMTSEQN